MTGSFSVLLNRLLKLGGSFFHSSFPCGLFALSGVGHYLSEASDSTVLYIIVVPHFLAHSRYATFSTSDIKQNNDPLLEI